jgi:hypothetical protein
MSNVLFLLDKLATSYGDYDFTEDGHLVYDFGEYWVTVTELSITMHEVVYNTGGVGIDSTREVKFDLGVLTKSVTAKD